MQCPAIQALDSVMALAVCASCGYANPIERFPLWFISGSSGSGKTTLAPQLRAWLPDGVVFEGDAIDYWRFQDPDGGYAPLYDQWLKVARELVANRRPVVLLAMATPDQLEASRNGAGGTAAQPTGLAQRRRAGVCPGGLRLHPVPGSAGATHPAGDRRRGYLYCQHRGDRRPGPRLGSPHALTELTCILSKCRHLCKRAFQVGGATPSMPPISRLRKPAAPS